MDAGGEQEWMRLIGCKHVSPHLNLSASSQTSQPLCLFYIEWGFILSFVALLYFQAANNPWLAVSHPACN